MAAVSADFPGLTASSLDNFSDLQYYLPEKAKKVKEDWAKKAEELQLNYRRGVYVWTSTIGGANKDAITLSIGSLKRFCSLMRVLMPRLPKWQIFICGLSAKSAGSLIYRLLWWLVW